MLKRLKAERVDSPDDGYTLYKHDNGAMVAIFQDNGAKIAYEVLNGVVQIADSADQIANGWTYTGADLRAAARDRTRSAACRMTDPQAPKSIWWYSDCTDIGFRVVREMTQEGELR